MIEKLQNHLAPETLIQVSADKYLGITQLDKLSKCCQCLDQCWRVRSCSRTPYILRPETKCIDATAFCYTLSFEPSEECLHRTDERVDVSSVRLLNSEIKERNPLILTDTDIVLVKYRHFVIFVIRHSDFVIPRVSPRSLDVPSTLPWSPAFARPRPIASFLPY